MRSLKCRASEEDGQENTGSWLKKLTTFDRFVPLLDSSWSIGRSQSSPSISRLRRSTTGTLKTPLEKELPHSFQRNGGIPLHSSKPYPLWRFRFRPRIPLAMSLKVVGAIETAYISKL